jgi:uncharacterized protein (TIGR03437 family)
VALESGGQIRPLTVLHADPDKIQAWIPQDALLGKARITVSSDGLTSAPQPLAILRAAPGLFSANGEGWGPVRSGNSPLNSVVPGGQLTLAATGAAPSDAPEVYVGNVLARVLSIQAASFPEYTTAITVQIPPDAPEGCFVPVMARVAGAPMSNTVTLAIHRGGGACEYTEDAIGGVTPGKTAMLALVRTVKHPLNGSPRTEDEFTAGFFDIPADPTRGSPLLLLPPPGVCATWSGVLSAVMPSRDSIWAQMFSDIAVRGLDAGTAIAIRSQTVQLRVPMIIGLRGLYRRVLSAPHDGAPVRNRISLDSGRLGIAGLGGLQVGPFAISLATPTPFAVPNRPPNSIGRGADYAITWDAGKSPGTMLIVVRAVDPKVSVVGMTYCTARQAAGKLTIPANLIDHIPAGRGDLVLASWLGQPLGLAPSGIAQMIGMSAFVQSWEVQIP